MNAPTVRPIKYTRDVYDLVAALRHLRAFPNDSEAHAGADEVLARCDMERFATQHEIASWSKDEPVYIDGCYPGGRTIKP